MDRRTGFGLERGRAARAFTLVELMVVIVIIAVLIGLLVPAINSVRTMARVAATKATLEALNVGLEAYKADGKIGGGYPPSSSDATGSDAPRGQVVNPYVTGRNTMSVSGACLAAWALSGADRLGTPGFQPVGIYTTWAGSTAGGDQDPTDPKAGLYALDKTTHQPVHARYGPYVDASKTRMSANAAAAGATPDFKIEAETAARAALGLPAAVRNYPMYLDTFGYPLLYWRADPAGQVAWDAIGFGQAPNPSLPRGMYHYADNSALVRNADSGAPPDDPRLVLTAGGGQHQLDFRNPPVGGTWSPTNLPPVGTFERYVLDLNIQAKLAPQRPDSYLLISPGPDAVYGTADDITNFQPNGR